MIFWFATHCSQNIELIMNGNNFFTLVQYKMSTREQRLALLEQKMRETLAGISDDDPESDVETGSALMQEEDCRSDGTCSDDSNSDSDSESKELDTSVNAVQVVEFNGDVPAKSQNTRQGWKEFMSSKITIKQKSTKKQDEIKQDKEDDMHDKELEDILKTTELVTRYTNAELTGKDRHEYIKSKLKELGGSEKPLKVSLPIHLGMKKKATGRVEKKVQELKNIGIYTKSLHREVNASEKSLNKGKQRKPNDKKEKGLVGSAGYISAGIMKVPKQLIDQVNKSKNNSRKGVGKNKRKH
jgi:hypothetical protein